MKEFTLNYVKMTKQENCYQDLKKPKSKKAILFKKIKNVVELPDIWKKSNQYKPKNETKPHINCEGNLYFRPPNPTINLCKKVPFTEINPTLGARTDGWSIINKPININMNGSTKNLLDTGVIGGFEYWDGDFIDLPN